MLSINTNLSSLIAQSSLKNSTNILNQAVERMSTGYKINHAKDNAANYSIATNMTTKMSALQVAEDNALQGLDMINTASESLSLIEDKLQRLRALATQASNDTYGTQSKQAINAEANALVDEIERIYSTAEYNGTKLFSQEAQFPDNPNIPKAQYNGFIKEVIKRDTTSMTTLASVDPNTTLADGTYSISTPEELKKLADMANAQLISSGDEFVLANDIDLLQYENWTPIGAERDNGDGTTTLLYFIGKFDGNGYEIKNLKITSTLGSRFAGLFGSSCGTIKNLGISNAFIQAGMQSGAIGGYITDGLIENCYAKDSNLVGSRCASLVGNTQPAASIDYCYAENVIVSGYQTGGLVGDHCGTIKNSFFIGELYANERSGGIAYALYPGATIDNVHVELNTSVTGAFAGGKGGIFTGDISITNCTFSSKQEIVDLITPGYGTVDIDENNIFYVFKNSNKILQVGINSGKENYIEGNFYYDISGIGYLRNLEFVNNFGSTFDYLDSFLKNISTKQTEYGAMTNRLESALNEISTQYENLASSRSTIRDADIAEESASYIQQQILQEAAATLLATANQSPAIALQLI